MNYHGNDNKSRFLKQGIILRDIFSIHLLFFEKKLDTDIPSAFQIVTLTS